MLQNIPGIKFEITKLAALGVRIAGGEITEKRLHSYFAHKICMKFSGS